MATPLQYPCLEHPMDRGAYQRSLYSILYLAGYSIAQRITKSWTRLSDFH